MGRIDMNFPLKERGEIQGARGLWTPLPHPLWSRLACMNEAYMHEANSTGGLYLCAIDGWKVHATDPCIVVKNAHLFLNLAPRHRYCCGAQLSADRGQKWPCTATRRGP